LLVRVTLLVLLAVLPGLWLGGCSCSRALPAPAAIMNRSSLAARDAGSPGRSNPGGKYQLGDTKTRSNLAVNRFPIHNPWKPDVDERDWEYIVLHHTASTSGNVELINRQHLNRTDGSGNHWLGIGYHFVIGNGKGMPDGEIEPTFRWNQQLHGAHAGVAAYNERGIGISLIGNFDESPPTSAQLASVKRLVSILVAEYGIAPENVAGHGDITATACPGRLFPLTEVRESATLALRYQKVNNSESSVRLATWEGSRRR
jgi:hypothetical protein